MSTRTERWYRLALADAGLLEGNVDDLPELEVLRAAVEGSRPPPVRSYSSSIDPWMDEVRRALDAGVGARALHDRLRREEPAFDGSLSAVKRAFARLRKVRGVRAEDVAIPVETAPGEVAQVDFGYVGKLFDPDTGRVRKAWLFVMVLAHSRHLFARAVFDQKSSTWMALHAEAFAWFGGVPRTVVPDNLKAAVVRAAFGAFDRHEIELNRSYREVARHFGFKVDPTPAYAPQKKGKVESAVKYIKRNLVAAGEFETVDELNAALPDWLTRIAGMRIHGSTGRRPLEHFADELEALLPLPPRPFVPVEWKRAKVHPDSHVEFDRRLYSVPWRTVGKEVWVRATPDSVYILLDDVRIATHERRGRGRRSTNDHHLPEHRRDLRHRSEAYWTKRAFELGPVIHQYILDVLASDDVLSKLREVQAIVTYLEPFPRHRAEAACRRAAFYGNHTYVGIKRILVNGLDLKPLPAVATRHGHLTTARFARTAAELLHHLPEIDDESH